MEQPQSQLQSCCPEEECLYPNDEDEPRPAELLPL